MEENVQLVFGIVINSMLSTERRRKCDVSVSSFFFRLLRKANYTRVVTTRSDYVEAGNVVGAGNYSSRIIKTNRVGF